MAYLSLNAAAMKTRTAVRRDFSALGWRRLKAARLLRRGLRPADLAWAYIASRWVVGSSNSKGRAWRSGPEEGGAGGAAVTARAGHPKGGAPNQHE